ncbi:MAG: hypothetical protein JW704_00685 [Anaerolineaceae bacterium]|nr:hypothetical protein [Anaerolineaceae bacterium]
MRIVEEDFYAESLADLRGLPFDGHAILTLTTPKMRLVASWPNVRRKILDDPTGDKRLHVAWHYVEFDAREWSQLSGYPEGVVWEHFYGLAAQKLIYPDGTYPEKVRQYLARNVGDLLGNDS